jgi:hypothetical protein
MSRRNFRAFLISAVTFASALILTALPAKAAPRDFAIGLSVGSPMGLSMLQNLSETEAVQAALEINVFNTLVAQADYLFKTRWPVEILPEYGKVYIYYGPGIRWEWGHREISPTGPYRTSEDGRFALRFPGGVQYYIPKLPFDTFVEVAPMLSLWSSTSVDLTAALGIRFNL